MTARLAALVRRELVRSERAQLARRRRLPLPPSPDPRRRLRRSPEGDRADLHVRFAAWLDEHGQRPRRAATRSSATTSSKPFATAPSSDGPTRLAGRARCGCDSPLPARRAHDRRDGRAGLRSCTRAADLLRALGFDLALELETARCVPVDGRAAARAADAVADAPRPRATTPGRCSQRARGASSSRVLEWSTSPRPRRAGGALPRSASRSRRSAENHGGSRCSGASLAHGREPPNAERHLLRRRRAGSPLLAASPATHPRTRGSTGR